MMRSLFSGVSGLKTHQTRMDVIGNNIANVNTTSYKSQSMSFSDLMYQTTQSASGPNAQTGAGGVNARQIGLGVKGSSISTSITSQGANQTTNNPFDFKITGDEFFVVSNGQSNFFTRDGAFYVDAAGNLVMKSNGYSLMGWQADQDTQEIKKDTVSPLKVMSAENMTYPAERTSKAMLSGIIDKNDTDFDAGAQGKTISLGIYDNLGYYYTLKFTMKKDDTDATGCTFNLDKNPSQILDERGNQVDPAVMQADLGTTKLQFDPTTGKITDPTDSIKLTISGSTKAFDSVIGKGTDAIPAKQINVDVSALTSVNNNGTSTVVADNGDADKLGTGRRVGNMTGLSVQQDGRIYAAYSNGQSRLIGQIAVASFANPSGLEKAGDNLYSATQNSGNFDGIGIDITGNGDYITSGVLEMSNVDLSSEFTEMITTQRGFQANSRIITVSDTMIEELVNLKR